MSLFDLSEKLVVVTGGSGLLGEPICVALENHGATVIVADINDEQGSELANRLEYGEFRPLDITDGDAVNTFCEQVISDHGRIDGLVNTAYPRTQEYGAPFESVNPDQWRGNIDAHLGGYYNIIREIALHMINAGGGSIVNFGSIYGLQAPDFGIYEGTDLTSPVEYSAIKAGILNLTRYLASYLGEDDVRVNAVSPGGVYNGQTEKFVKNYSRNTPLRRMAEPGDIPGAVIYLLSDAASYVTGHNLIVDGGWTIK